MFKIDGTLPAFQKRFTLSERHYPFKQQKIKYKQEKMEGILQDLVDCWMFKKKGRCFRPHPYNIYDKITKVLVKTQFLIIVSLKNNPIPSSFSYLSVHTTNIFLMLMLHY